SLISNSQPANSWKLPTCPCIATVASRSGLRLVTMVFLFCCSAKSVTLKQWCLRDRWYLFFATFLQPRLIRAGYTAAIESAHVAERHRIAGRVLGDHSITSSASNCTELGTARPSVLAVLRLTTISEPSTNSRFCSVIKDGQYLRRNRAMSASEGKADIRKYTANARLMTCSGYRPACLPFSVERRYAAFFRGQHAVIAECVRSRPDARWQN